MKAMMYNRQWWIGDTDPDRLNSNLTAMLKGSNFGVLEVAEHRFEPYGYTCLWLLSESHLAVHTFPEENKSYIELSSCVKTPFNLFCNAFGGIYGKE